jgi:GNAT superfamily N-acetyltransferase
LPALRIDPCGFADLPAVQRLADVIWRQHYPGIITVAQIDYMLAMGYSTAALSSLLEAPHAGIAIARSDGEPVGFAAWYPASEPATTKLDKLYVLPALHGRGIGRRLIEHVERAARGAGSRTIVLNVNKRNTKSIAAYERCGFVVREPVVVDIGAGFVMDDFVLAKALA